MARAYDIGARLVRGAELQELMPGVRKSYRCALHVPTDGCAEPQKATPAIARAAQRRGAILLAHCAVRGLEREAGRVSAVVTERGPIRCDAVILAGGAWSSLFCASLGIRLPQVKVLSSVLRTAAVAGPDTCTHLKGLGYRRRLDGGYTIARGTGAIVPLAPDSLRYLREFLPSIRRDLSALRFRINAQSLRELSEPRRWPLDRPSPFERTRVLDPAPNKSMNREARDAMIELFPQFRDVRGRTGMGRLHRCHAGCRALHRQRERGPRLDRRNGIFRPWIRHRPGGRTARRGNRDRSDTLGRPGAVSPLTLQRRLADLHRSRVVARRSESHTTAWVCET